MATTFIPGALQWLGIAKETTYGTPVAAPTIWVPVDTPLWKPIPQQLKDNALRGLMGTTYQQVQGVRHDEITYKTYIYADSIFSHLLGVLGGTDTVTGTVAPYTHKASLYNTTDATHNAQPTSWTVFLYQGDGKVVQMPGAIISDIKITIKADNSLPTVDVTWMGMPSTFVTAPVDTPTALAPMPAYTASVTIGGTANTEYTDVTLDIKRTTSAIPVLNGTQSPLAIGGFNLNVTGTINGVYQGTTDVNLTDLLSNTHPSLVVALTAAGDATHPLTLQMTSVAFDTVNPTGSPTSYMPISGNFEALMNPTDALDSKQSPIQVQLTNTTVTPF